MQPVLCLIHSEIGSQWSCFGGLLLCTWQVELNPSKCNACRVLSSKQRKVLISSDFLHGRTLETVNASKYLGITISCDLSWSAHVEDVAGRGNWTVGFLRRNFRECSPKVRRNFRSVPQKSEGTSGSVPQKWSQGPTLQWYAPHWSMPQLSSVPTTTIKDIQLLGKLQLLGNYNAELPGTWPTTTWTRHRHCYLHAHKSDVDKPWTTKMTDPPGDALQNQPWPCRCKPSKVLPPLWPQDQRSTKTAPGTGTTPRPLQLLTLYSLYNTTQYNTTLLPQYNTTLLKECQYTAWGMFCDAKDTHSHTFTPIIKHLITTTAKKHPGEKSFTEKNMKNPMASSCAYHIKPWMEPPPHGCFFSPFTQVLPESSRPQSSQCAASPHPSMNTKTVCIVLTLDWLFYLKF